LRWPSRNKRLQLQLIRSGAETAETPADRACAAKTEFDPIEIAIEIAIGIDTK
jgi:hypothetical protein